MRRVHGVVTALLIATLLLAGCAGPSVGDKDLINGWPAMPSAGYDAAAAGQCLGGTALNAFEAAKTFLPPVDCAEKHLVEIVLVGKFNGAAASAASPPALDSAASRAAYAECDKAAKQYLGGDWRVSRLFPHLGVPRPVAWQGGARQWVCGLAESADDLYSARQRTGSVKGGLASNRPLALTCVLLSGGDVSAEGFYGSVDTVRPIDCGEPHDTEFVGVYTAPAGKYPDAKRLDQLATNACYAKIATYLSLTQNQLYERGDVYTFWTGLNANQWSLGDRTAHCFLNTSSKKLVRGSLKGLGTKPLPAS